jgi:hypothetical protein
VREGARNGADDVEAEAAIDLDRGAVGLGDGIELHSGVAVRACPVERIAAERGADAAPARFGPDHEAGGGDMRARAGAVRPHFGAAQDAAVFGCDDRLSRRRFDPDAMRLCFAHRRIVREGIGGTHDVSHDRPDLRPVRFDEFPYPHGLRPTALCDRRHCMTRFIARPCHRA